MFELNCCLLVLDCYFKTINILQYHVKTSLLLFSICRNFQNLYSWVQFVFLFVFSSFRTRNSGMEFPLTNKRMMMTLYFSLIVKEEIILNHRF